MSSPLQFTQSPATGRNSKTQCGQHPWCQNQGNHPAELKWQVSRGEGRDPHHSHKMTERHLGLISASSHLGISNHHFGIYRPFPGLSGIKETSLCGLTPTPRLTPCSDTLMFLSVNRIIPWTEKCLWTTGHQKGADLAPLRTAPGYLTRIISSNKAVCGPVGLLWAGSLAWNPKGTPLWICWASRWNHPMKHFMGNHESSFWSYMYVVWNQKYLQSQECRPSCL